MKNNLSIIDLYKKIKYLNEEDIDDKLGYEIYPNGNYKLNRDYQLYTLEAFNRVKKVLLPRELTQDFASLDYKKIKNHQFSQDLLNFTQVLQVNFNKDDLYNLYRNLNSLVVKEKKANKNILAEYNMSYNCIFLYGDYVKTDLYHELFHLASTNKDNEGSNTGFMYGTVGVALNEGYTDLLTDRYFNYGYESENSYLNFKRVTNVIENVVGKDKMQSLYLNANLNGLIKELNKYGSQEQISLFITSLDYIDENMESAIDTDFYKNIIIENYKSINKFLIELATKKILYNNEFYKSFEIVYDEVEELISPLMRHIVINGEKVNLSESKDLIRKYMNNKSR